MKTFVIALLAGAALLATSVSVLADDLNADMDILNANLHTVLNTDDVAEMQNALSTMRAAALAAQQATPPQLDGLAPDSPERQEYRYGLDLMIGQIDGALRLVAEGKIPEAKAAAEDVRQTRNRWQQKFR